MRHMLLLRFSTRSSITFARISQRSRGIRFRSVISDHDAGWCGAGVSI